MQILLATLKLLATPLMWLYKGAYSSRMSEARYSISEYLKREYQTSFTQTEIFNMLDSGLAVDEIIERISA